MKHISPFNICLTAGLFFASAMTIGCQKERAETNEKNTKTKEHVLETHKDIHQKKETKKAEKPEPKKKNVANPNAYKKADVTYTVKLETSEGDILIDVYKSLAPLAAERFKTLVKEGFYDEARFFRVIKGFVAQAGIAGDPKVNAAWRTKQMKDDPVIQSNLVGTVSFASAGPNSRTTQFFINYRDNKNLDGMGFAPFGKVREMDVVNKFYVYKGNTPRQPLIQRAGNEYLKKEFPKLTYIKKATIIETK